MSLTKEQIKIIEHKVRTSHKSYACIAGELGIPIDEVRKIGAPINAERRKTRDNWRDLDKLTQGATYDRKTYDDPAILAKPHPSATFVGAIITTCLVAIIIAATIGLVKLCLGI